MVHSTRSPSLLLSAALLLATALLAACGQQSGTPASQVAAKVNKEEISVHQVNFVLQRQPGLKPEQADAAGRQVLERLIDQEVVLQKAREQKIDRDPRVVQEIEAARREIIARAYAGRVGESVGKPADDEIKAYYESKPALFRERRIYTLQEVQVEAGKEQVAALQAALAGFKSIDDVATYVRANKLATRVSQSTTAAENLPMAGLDRFAALREGQTLFSAVPGGARLVTLVQARPAPITEEQARPVIEQFLLNERKRKAVEEELRTIRTAAQIEYVGQFAATAASAPATAGAAAAPEAVAAAPAASAAASAALDADALSKGLSGLK